MHTLPPSGIPPKQAFFSAVALCHLYTFRLFFTSLCTPSGPPLEAPSVVAPYYVCYKTKSLLLYPIFFPTLRNITFWTQIPLSGTYKIKQISPYFFCAHNSEDAKRAISRKLIPHVLWPVYDFLSLSSVCERGDAFTSGFYYHPPRRSPGRRFACSGKNSLKLLTTYYLLLTT